MFSNDIALTIVVVTLLMFLLIAGVIITMFIANKKHVQQQVKMTQMELNYEKELRTVEHEVQEQVLTNVARELHDNIGQLLTFMRIQLEHEKLDRPEAAAQLAPLDNTLTDTIQQVRLLSHSLNTDKLEQLGLIKAIENETFRLQQVRTLAISFEHDSAEPSFSKDQRIMVFRIFQEILNNMLKHAAAKNIRIKLEGNKRFALTISDDGKGFDLPEKMPGGSGIGLINMMKRAKLSNMDLAIDTAKGKGSTFTLSLQS
jgi:signal transduction histidine kinase